jgi:hypothetical protein
VLRNRSADVKRNLLPDQQEIAMLGWVSTQSVSTTSPPRNDI